MDRRDFLKTASLSSLGLVLSGEAEAGAPTVAGGKEFCGVLVDTTLCIGCLRCEKACAEVNDLPLPDIPALGEKAKFDAIFAEKRPADTERFTVVNRYDTERGEVFVKTQCMHCNQPGCDSACLVHAMYKTHDGPVIWKDDKCMGCRYCMIACPFDVPKFEYHSWNPRIRKCTFCFDRLKEGKLPGCVEACPVEALLYGSRRELMQIASERIYQNPGKYIPYIYGEDEVGGTGWLYLSAVPFDQIGFRTDLGKTPIPEYSKGFLFSVAQVLLVWPVFLLGVSYARKKLDSGKEEH